MSTDDVILRLSHITKTFPGVTALDDVSFEARRGEVHALCGENGAGKSTLMNVLAGIYHPDAGRIEVNGRPVTIESQHHSQALGIATVYQDRSLVENLSVAENIFANRQPVNALGLIDSGRLYRQSREFLDELELADIDPRMPLGRLSSAKQQMVEIAKALSQDPAILLLDEPTATITEVEVNALFRIVRMLLEKGVCIVYISHRMSEIFAIADRVSVLKDGRGQGTRTVADCGVDDIIRMMVGRDLAEQAHVTRTTERVVLEAERLAGERFEPVSFRLHAGEILALAGLVGAGRTEIARVIIGADRKTGGRLRLYGEPCDIRHPAEAVVRGIGYVPEDRKAQGLFLEMSVEQNVISACLESAATHGWIQARRITEIAERYREKLRIRTPSVRQLAMNLSGGNQQKVVLSKWLVLNPKILIVDEPTHGVDVGAKAEIHAILRALAAEGSAVLMISSELPEVLAVSDRVLVMWNGRLTAELGRAEASEEEIMHYASGTRVARIAAGESLS
ncbi:MAG: sugar ABC transporter ATP-binding protein [Kiritimatiellae bacterium]|nr:sugar ABC transporter ATP-binding protein [Kiritimatiellia bacterium]